MLIPIAQAAAEAPGIDQIITKATALIQQVVVLIFVLAIVVFAWGIVKMISAAGNAEKLKQAKGIIWWGIIGMFVLAAIGGIIAFLRGELGIDTITNIKAPQFTPQSSPAQQQP